MKFSVCRRTRPKPRLVAFGSILLAIFAGCISAQQGPAQVTLFVPVNKQLANQPPLALLWLSRKEVCYSPSKEQPVRNGRVWVDAELSLPPGYVAQSPWRIRRAGCGKFVRQLSTAEAKRTANGKLRLSFALQDDQGERLRPGDHTLEVLLEGEGGSYHGRIEVPFRIASCVYM